MMASRRIEMSAGCATARQNVSDKKQQPKSAMIYPMQRVTSVQKADSVKRVAHEPVKGAVTPMSTATPMSKSVSQSPMCKSVPLTSMSKSNPVVTAAELRPLPQMDFNRASNLHPLDSASVTMGMEQCSTASNVVDMRKATITSNVDSTLLNNDSARYDQLAQDILKNSFSSSTLNPLSHPESDGNISTQLTSLKEQLEVQTKVNSDLKKLLVASIGDDLHYKVDALVRTKVQLANEIDDYTRKLVEDYEDLDKVTIQADLWHSKYQACRVLADQLTAERDKLSNICCQATSALQQLLTDRQHLQQQQRYLNRGLLALHNMFSSSSPNAAHTAVTCDGDNMALAGANNWLINDLCYSLLGTRPSLISTQNRPTCNTMTHSEHQAYQVLVDANKELPYSSGNSALTNQVHPLPRFHVGARYDGFTMSCCRHCKGEIYVV